VFGFEEAGRRERERERINGSMGIEKTCLYSEERWGDDTRLHRRDGGMQLASFFAVERFQIQEEESLISHVDEEGDPPPSNQITPSV